MLLVFSFLPVADLQRASRVNHTWMRIALDQQFAHSPSSTPPPQTTTKQSRHQGPPMAHSFMTLVYLSLKAIYCYLLKELLLLTLCYIFYIPGCGKFGVRREGGERDGVHGDLLQIQKAVGALRDLYSVLYRRHQARSFLLPTEWPTIHPIGSHCLHSFRQRTNRKTSSSPRTTP